MYQHVCELTKGSALKAIIKNKNKVKKNETKLHDIHLNSM